MRYSKLPLDELISFFLKQKREGEFWDFKQEWHEKTEDLLKDIICFANTVHDEDCFIIFGIADDLSITGMAGERKKQADIIDTISNLSFAGDNLPSISLESLIFQDVELDVLRVYNTNKTPVYLKKQYGKMRPGCIYARIGDKNTPDNGNAEIGVIENLWRKRFGLTKAPLDYIFDELVNKLNWVKSDNGYYNIYLPEYTLECSEEDYEAGRRTDEFYSYVQTNESTSYYMMDIKARGKTAKSILISCGARLAVFDIQELRELTAYDELELDTLGDKKTALFLIMSDTDSTFNFLISMAYTQLFNLLCEKADDVYGGRLPVHVRCLIDEMANIGQIPNLEKLIATIRSREISACLVLQARSQLKSIYKDNADTIIGNCDSQIFLGGSEPTTLKELTEALGKETIDTFNTSDTRGNSPSYGTNYQKLGKELMSRDELAVMNGSKCILQLRGVRPFLSDKYDLTQHPNFKYTADFDKKYTFDIEKYLNRRMKLKKDEVFDVVEV